MVLFRLLTLPLPLNGLRRVPTSQITMVASNEAVANLSLCSELRIDVTFWLCWFLFQNGALASSCCESTAILASVSNSHACTVPSSNPHTKMDVPGTTMISVNDDLLPTLLVSVKWGCAKKKDTCFNFPALDTDQTLTTPSILADTMQSLDGDGAQDDKWSRCWASNGIVFRVCLVSSALLLGIWITPTIAPEWPWFELTIRFNLGDHTHNVPWLLPATIVYFASNWFNLCCLPFRCLFLDFWKRTGPPHGPANSDVGAWTASVFTSLFDHASSANLCGTFLSSPLLPPPLLLPTATARSPDVHEKFATQILVTATCCVLSSINLIRLPPCFVSEISTAPSLHPKTIASRSFHHSDTRRVDVGVFECKLPMEEDTKRPMLEEEEEEEVTLPLPLAGVSIAVVAPNLARPRAIFVGEPLRLPVLALPRNDFFSLCSFVVLMGGAMVCLALVPVLPFKTWIWFVGSMAATKSMPSTRRRRRLMTDSRTNLHSHCGLCTSTTLMTAPVTLKINNLVPNGALTRATLITDGGYSRRTPVKAARTILLHLKPPNREPWSASWWQIIPSTPQENIHLWSSDKSNACTRPSWLSNSRNNGGREGLEDFFWVVDLVDGVVSVVPVVGTTAVADNGMIDGLEVVCLFNSKRQTAMTPSS